MSHAKNYFYNVFKMFAPLRSCVCLVIVVLLCAQIYGQHSDTLSAIFKSRSAFASDTTYACDCTTDNIAHVGSQYSCYGTLPMVTDSILRQKSIDTRYESSSAVPRIRPVCTPIVQNDLCDHPSGDRASCKHMAQCPEAKILIERNVVPTMCDVVHEGEALVCCKEDMFISTPLLLISSEVPGSNNEGGKISEEKSGSISQDEGCTGSACVKSFGVPPFMPQNAFNWAQPPGFPPFGYNSPQNFGFPPNNFRNHPGRPEQSYPGNFHHNHRIFPQNQDYEKELFGAFSASWHRPHRPTDFSRPTFSSEEERKPSENQKENVIRFPDSDHPRNPAVSEESNLRESQEESSDMRISQKMCGKYSSSTASISLNPQGLLLRPFKDNFKLSVCSRKSVPLIINGVNALPGEFPHMAALGYLNPKNQTNWDCGGSLISEYFVLTAAHCVTTKGAPVVARLGEHNVYSDEDGAQPRDFDVDESIVFDAYNSDQLYHDIALLRLRQRVRFDNFIRPACLPSEDFAYSAAIATGWGLTDAGGDKSDVLQKVLLSPVPPDRCKRAYGAESTTRRLFKGIDPVSQLCYGESEGRDTAQGDSGGPLQVADKNCNYYVVGVTSFGKYFGKKSSAGVYTRVQHYLDWIERVVWPNT